MKKYKKNFKSGLEIEEIYDYIEKTILINSFENFHPYTRA